MATNRTRRGRGRSAWSEGLSEADYIYYTSGDFWEAEGYEDGKSEEELKSFWIKHREPILKRYLEENRAKSWKAVRPWYFWRVDMLEPRLKTSPGQFEANKHWDHQRGKYDWVESDFDYLKRLGQLQDWELEQEEKKII